MSGVRLEAAAAEKAGGGEPVRVLALRSVDGAGGGAEAVLLRTASTIEADRVKLTLCCIHRPNDAQFDFDRRAAARGVECVCVHQHSIRARGVLKELQRIVRDRQIEIVDAQDYKAAYFAWRLAQREGIIPVSTLHGWSGHHLRERCVYYPAEKLIVSRFPLVIAVSSEIAEAARRWGARREAVHVLANGIDPEAFCALEGERAQVRAALGYCDAQFVVGAVGRLEEEKRYDVLIDAFAAVHQRYPQARLALVGEGTCREQLQGRIDRLGVSSACQLLGHRRDVRELFQAFDVFVQSSDHEGSPTVVVEAMAIGAPVVATAVGGTADLLRDGQEGLLAPRRDPAALAAAVENVLVDPCGAVQRATAARRRVETTLSFAARTRKLEDLYCRTADAHGRRPSRAGDAIIQDWARNPCSL